MKKHLSVLVLTISVLVGSIQNVRAGEKDVKYAVGGGSIFAGICGVFATMPGDQGKRIGWKNFAKVGATCAAIGAGFGYANSPTSAQAAQISDRTFKDLERENGPLAATDTSALAPQASSAQ